jgi:hypothetical protein
VVGFKRFRRQRSVAKGSPFWLRLTANGPRRLQSKFVYRSDESRKDSVEVDYYFFIPKQLGIDANHYPKSIFYRNLDSIVRRRAPHIPLDKPQYLYNALTDAENIENFERRLLETKLLCCAFHRYVQSTVRYLSACEPHDNETRCGSLSDEVDCFLRVFANSLKRLECQVREAESTVKQHYQELHSLREYCNLVAEKEAYQLLQSRFGQSASNQNCLLLLVNRLHLDRINHGYQSIAETEGVNEYFIYRFKGLRRFAEEPLNLTNLTAKVGEYRQQLIYGLAAGVAMTFATTIAFYTQQKYGNFSQAFFVALVVSYVFKDRLKELTRSYAHSNLMYRIGDYRTKLLRGGRGAVVGESRQSARFVEREKCEPEILDMAKRSRIGDMADYGLEHSIMHYKRKISVNNNFFRSGFLLELPRQLVDINIFNIEKFLRNIVPSDDNIWAMGRLTPVKIRSQRVHHVIMVVKMKNSTSSSLKSWCVVLGQRGIKRIVEREKEQPIDMLWQRSNDKTRYEALLIKQMEDYQSSSGGVSFEALLRSDEIDDERPGLDSPEPTEISKQQR